MDVELETTGEKWPMVAGWRHAQLKMALRDAEFLEGTISRFFDDPNLDIPKWRVKSITEKISALVKTLRDGAIQEHEEIYEFCRRL